MKRLAGWKQDGRHLSRTVRMVVGLEPFVDVEAEKARKQAERKEAKEAAEAAKRELSEAEREARDEREAIQWASRLDELLPPKTHGQVDGSDATKVRGGDSTSDGAGLEGSSRGTIRPRGLPAAESEVMAVSGLVPRSNPPLSTDQAAPPKTQARRRRSTSARSVTGLETETPEGAEPKAAAAGWYRLGSSFYRLGEGPHPKYQPMNSESSVERTTKPPATTQLTLF